MAGDIGESSQAVWWLRRREHDPFFFKKGPYPHLAMFVRNDRLGENWQ